MHTQTVDNGIARNGAVKAGTFGKPVMASESVSSVRAMQRGTARWVATITLGILAVSVTLVGGVELLSPGPMATPHGSVQDCKSCHSNIKPGPVGWVHNVFAASDPRKDSEACLTCHKIAENATNPHTANLKDLERLTERIKKNATSAPVADRLREIAFPVDKTFSEGVFCQTCHEEHKGEQFDLKSMADGRCQACHTSVIHNFDNDHPGFGGYPFKRRTRISFDHANHFNKHYPDEIKKKKRADAVPDGCSGCHKAGPDNQHMGVVDFKQVCSACHIGQIVGTERPEGPKGITLLTIPGLDVDTLAEKGAKIGEWPAESEAELTPFMELLIGTDAKRRKILASVKDVDLLDLSGASDETISAVRALAWEVKELIHTYSSSKPSAVVDRLSTATGLEVDSDLVAKLVASMPRDVLMSAQRQWLPNLTSEIEARNAGSGDDADDAGNKDEKAEVENEEQEGQGDTDQDADLEEDASLEEDADLEEDASQDDDSILEEDASAEEDATEDDDSILADDAEEGEEKEETEKAEENDEDEGEDKKKAAGAKEAEPEPELAVDAETWTEFGGWYRQDYSILYKPRGHKDEFMKAWLDFSGPPVHRQEQESCRIDLQSAHGQERAGPVHQVPQRGRTGRWNAARQLEAVAAAFAGGTVHVVLSWPPPVHRRRKGVPYLPQAGCEGQAAGNLQAGQPVYLRLEFRSGRKEHLRELSQTRRRASGLPALPHLSCAAGQDTGAENKTAEQIETAVQLVTRARRFMPTGSIVHFHIADSGESCAVLPVRPAAIIAGTGRTQHQIWAGANSARVPDRIGNQYPAVDNRSGLIRLCVYGLWIAIQMQKSHYRHIC